MNFSPLGMVHSPGEFGVQFISSSVACTAAKWPRTCCQRFSTPCNFCQDPGHAGLTPSRH
eukprot:4521998-Pyramimonas_sp.AAC.1